MKILLYILTPVGAYIINLLLSGIIPLITIPVTWVFVKVQKNKPNLYGLLYGFRPDIVIQGIIRGILVVYLTFYVLSLFETKVVFWWIFASIVGLSYLSIYAWDRTKPFEYEFSIAIPPILGFIIGLFVIY